MILYKTLTTTPIREILTAFNRSFSDYIVPMHLSLEQFEAKIEDETIRMDLSAGAFKDGILIGFVLFARRGNQAYNAGTGVVPEFRGRSITKHLHDLMLPILKWEGVESVALEVITTNAPAIRIYESIGFKKQRTLNCFRGHIETEKKPDYPDIRVMQNTEWELMKPFWDFEPTWQNSLESDEQDIWPLLFSALYIDDVMKGYIAYNFDTRKLLQIAVDKDSRRQQIGTQLLAYLATFYDNDLTALNVEAGDNGFKEFASKNYLEPLLQQYEMKLQLIP